MTEKKFKFKLKHLNEAINHYNDEMYKLLKYINSNPDKPKIIQIKTEALLYKINDLASEKTTGDTPEKTYKKINWPAIYKDREKGMTNKQLSEKHDVLNQTISHHFKHKFDPLKKTIIMGQSEIRTQLQQIWERIENILDRLDKVEEKLYNWPDADYGEISSPLKVKRKETYNIEKKIAVYAPEPWMKEKVAKVWGREMRDSLYDENKEKYIFINPDVNALGIADKVFVDQYLNFEVISFQDFCKQHGISDKPDYRKQREGNTVVKVQNYEPESDSFWDIDNKFHPSTFWQPATEKEYLEQKERKKIDFSGLYDYVFNDDLNVIEEVAENVDSYIRVWEKEPELKLHEEWMTFKEGVGYYTGAKDMQKAIYDRAYEYWEYLCRINYKADAVETEQTFWRDALEKTFEDMKQRKIKPPKF